MDEHVLRGMARWPDVPAVYGWLALDRRGTWLLQRSPIMNPTITDYIGRNYESDAEGRWIFQNGPHRVFVGLDYTPLVYRATASDEEPLEIRSHTGKRATALSGAWLDEHGALLVETEHGVGVMHDQDLDAALAALAGDDGNALPENALEERLELVQARGEASLWLKLGASRTQLRSIESADVPRRFGFIGQPTA